MKAINMGIGKLGDRNLIFIRTFRYTISAKNLPEHLTKNLSIDYLNKTIGLSIYEISEGNKPKHNIQVHKWLENVNKPLTITTYDGCGNPIYQMVLKGLKLLSRTSEFNYSVSDITTQEIKLSFNEYKFKYEKNADFGKSMPEPKTKEPERPCKCNLELEETEISHMNAKTWIPGKVKKVKIIPNKFKTDS